MKTNARLILSAVLLFPATYAIPHWFILDMNYTAPMTAARIEVYRTVLPAPGLSFSQQILCLLAITLVGSLISIPAVNGKKRPIKMIRVLLLILGFSESGMLAFSLM